MAKAKRQSDQRFEQYNALCDRYVQTLPKTSQRLAVLLFFRHANNPRWKAEYGPFAFGMSLNRLARCGGMARSRAQDIFAELTELGVIEKLRDRQGTMPAVYKLTWKVPVKTRKPR